MRQTALLELASKEADRLGLTLPQNGEIEVSQVGGVWQLRFTDRSWVKIGGYDPTKWPQYLTQAAGKIRTVHLELRLNGATEREALARIRPLAEAAAREARALGAPEYVITEYVMRIVSRYNFEGRGNSEKISHESWLTRLENHPDTVWAEIQRIAKENEPEPAPTLPDHVTVYKELVASSGRYRAPKYRRDWHWKPPSKKDEKDADEQLQQQRPERVAASILRGQVVPAERQRAERVRLDVRKEAAFFRSQAREAFIKRLETSGAGARPDTGPATVTELHRPSEALPGDVPHLREGVNVLSRQAFDICRAKLWRLIPESQKSAKKITIGRVQILLQDSGPTTMENYKCPEEFSQITKPPKPSRRQSRSLGKSESTNSHSSRAAQS